jgi:hypothetical protein
MNSTIWSSTEEAVVSFILAPITIFVFAYAIFLCNAIYDYQDEKPKDEKSPTDILIKDIKNVEFWFFYVFGLIRFISLFTPPTTSIIVYLISYFFIFINNFYFVSWLVFLYIQYVYVFQHEQFSNVNLSSMWWKSLGWKFLLTFPSLSLNIVFPLENIPLPFQMLSKGCHYDRYLFWLFKIFSLSIKTYLN